MNEFILNTISNTISPVHTLVLASFHAFLFALPVNCPSILCFINLHYKGFTKGAISYFTSALSETVFITLIIYGSYSIIQVWYDIEPFIFLLGFILTFQIMCASTLQPVSTHNTNLLGAFHRDSVVNIATFRKQLLLIFLLQLCNPVSLFQPTRYVTSFELTSFTPNVSNGLIYMSCFCISLFVFSTCIGTLISTILNSFDPSLPLAIFMSTLLFTGISKYTWRMFTQYPFDVIGKYFDIEGITREVPSKDSGIRRRFIDNPSIGRPRRIPIEEFSEALQIMREEKSSKSEKINMYFDEESKRSREQVILRFKSHFVNRFITKVNQLRVFIRTPFSHNRTVEQIEYLQPADNTDTVNTLNNNKKKGRTKYGYLRLQPK